MDRNYYDILVKQLQNSDFNDVLEELKYKSIEEVISNLLNKKEGFEIINAYESRYEDDILDVEEEIGKVENEFTSKINELANKEEEIEKNRLEYIKTYNEYNRKISGYNNKPIEDSIGTNLRKIDVELKELSKKEELLDGKLSNRMLNKKEKLLNRREELLNQKEKIKSSKEEIYQQYLSDLNEIEELKNQRNLLIKQLAHQKVELYKKRGELRIKIKKYQFIQFEMFIKLIQNKTIIDNEFKEVEKRFNEALKSDDKSYIATLGQEYIEKKNKKIDFDKKVEQVANLFGTTMKELGLEEQVEEKKEIVQVPKQEIINVSQKEIENPIIEENNDVEKPDIEVKPLVEEQLEQPIEIEDNQKEEINPIMWYENYKEQLLKDQELSNEEVVELINYVDQLKNEFMHLFASFARISDSKYKIKEALNNTKKLVEQKRIEMLEKREQEIRTK